MQLLNLTLSSPAENLALDEALLDAAEAGEGGEVLRLWESPAPLVVIGRSSKIAEEVELPRCRELGVPVLRRASGGAAIVAGPGCLMYGVVLNYQQRPELRMLDWAHDFVLSRIVAALRELGLDARRCGTSDLATGDRKFSGNSLRCKRDHLLYHGTLLYNCPLELIGRLLHSPPRQPEYRAGRAHGEFVGNLPLSPGEIRAALVGGFAATRPLTAWPQQRVAELAAERYSRDDWNLAR
jgi:lipoate-protein ligase A